MVILLGDGAAFNACRFGSDRVYEAQARAVRSILPHGILTCLIDKTLAYPLDETGVEVVLAAYQRMPTSHPLFNRDLFFSTSCLLLLSRSLSKRSCRWFEQFVV